MNKKLSIMSLNEFVKKKCFVFGLAFLCFFIGLNHSVNAEKVTLTDNGLALHSIVVSNGATKHTYEVANELAKYLGRITGGEFLITVGDGSEGIAVGTYKEFSQLGFESLFNSDDLMRRDEYLLRTHNKGVHLVGATDLALQHAVWGFLYKLGYRQFFPTDSWEVIPNEPNLSVEIDVFEKPDFYTRTAPHYAAYSDRKLWPLWEARNRTVSSFKLLSGHTYGSIMNRNKAAFNEHPEYLGLVDGVRGKGRKVDLKFCISNKDLRSLVIEDAKRRILKNPDIACISMEPSDGGNWCECEKCAEMGSISDRVVILANEVAEAINNMDHGEKYVGILAYNEHSPPPTIDVHPKVIVSIATNFIRGGWTLEELIEGWSKYSKMIGIYDYHDVFKWSFGKPHKAKGGNINYLKEKIPYFYNQGARIINSESSDSWVPNGLGYYFSALLLWDLSAVDRVDEIVEDFVRKSFGEAYEPMQKFYYMINQDYDTPRTNDDLLAHMYEYINEAYILSKDPKVHARLDDLVLYSKYLELWFRFENSTGKPARLKAAQDVHRHAYRMQNTMMIHIYSLYLYLRRVVKVPDEVNPGHLSVGKKLEDMEPWMSSKSFGEDEIKQFIEDGIAAYKKDNMDFKPLSFSEDLVPAAEILGLPRVSTGDFGRNNQFSGEQKMFTWLKSDNKQLNLQVTGGIIKHFRDRGNVRFKLFSPKEVLVEPVDTDESVPPDGETYNVVLKSPYDGIHELAWDDGRDITRLKWPEGTPMTVRSSMNDPAKIGNNRKVYFYVPKGTKVVGGYTSGDKVYGYTRVHDGSGDQVFAMSDVEGGEGYFSIPVAEGQDGKLWSFQRGYGIQVLMTVPPYLARNEKELLLPKEVVEADK